ncbi:hypothetical protein HYH02_006470 [Chlamydomonas schloesseri]|uniref:Kinesin motor domain-containing protein n=1 Tax=Chlamydomonas schloesseri TaxID=2026947 RepID=A0A835WJV8_9CHLO|nr:hypothetical protein HYH02_006470 [Chlamydomonas schloesseri]|eukprot:KAG2448579.1 hypothetical protein HYH02_006470 [Chlamydomonas schloesseri]
MGAMEGYNGTIFAYGQTGSGKTFTITGGPERYVDRGIIPRSITAIFGEISKRHDYQYSVHISYLEIYNNEGYDLLDAEREVKALKDLQQVHVGEADDGTVSYRNLSMYRANNEEEALNLLFQGDFNRTISKTPMNQASSRSHCIFTIHVEARKSGEDVVRRSKLNLVDLAGSDRESKPGVGGTTLRKAKYTNLSLHYLEQVIIALQEKAMGMNRPHIPYRNSMMTMALKDSLGGNCRTTMIATINSAQDQLDESISTCRFAQRVAMVRNTVLLNEELAPSLIIRRLKQEVRDLKEEVRMLRGEEEERGPLTPDELVRLQGQVETYVADNSSEASLNLGGSMMTVRAVFEIFKRLLRTGGFKMAGSGGAGGSGGAAGEKGEPGTPGRAGSTDAFSPAGSERLRARGGEGGGGGDSAGLQDLVRKLKLHVAQRDNEIGILVSMLKQREAAGAKADPVLSSPSSSINGPPVPGMDGAAAVATAGGGAEGYPAAGEKGGGGGGGGVAEEMAVLMNINLLADRNKAFELFRKSYRQNEVIEENKQLLKAKYDSAKSLGAAVNDSEGRINELRAAIEQRRMQRGAAAVAAGMSPEQLTDDDPEESRCKELMEQEKARYRDAFNQLRDLKKEVEHLHLLLEQSQTHLQRDFEQWMGLMLRQQQQQQQGGAAGLPPPGPSPAMSPMRPSGAVQQPGVPRQAWGDAGAAPSPSASPAPGPGPRGSGGSFTLGPSPGGSATPPPLPGAGGQWATPVGLRASGGSSPALGGNAGYGNGQLAPGGMHGLGPGPGPGSGAGSPAVTRTSSGVPVVPQHGLSHPSSGPGPQVAQRNNETGILVSMLKRREAAGAKAGPFLSRPSSSINGPPVPGRRRQLQAAARRGMQRQGKKQEEAVAEMRRTWRF